MGECERCGIEFQAYCAKCREEIRRKEMPAIPTDNLVVLLAYDKTTKLYRYGCSVADCPCNLQNGWCSKGTPFLEKNVLHEYDGDNAVKQWCG